MANALRTLQKHWPGFTVTISNPTYSSTSLGGTQQTSWTASASNIQAGIIYEDGNKSNTNMREVQNYSATIFVVSGYTINEGAKIVDSNSIEWSVTSVADQGGQNTVTAIKVARM